MAFLSRLAMRALPKLARSPVAMPKTIGRPGPLLREAEPAEEEQVAPWRVAPSRPVRRKEEPAEEETMARAAEATAPAPEEEEPEAKRAPAPGKSEEEQKDELAPLRRAAEEEEDQEVAPLRRAEQTEEEDEPAVQPKRFIRRAEEVPLDEGEKPLRQPFEADLAPGAMPAHPDLANEEEPSALQALRRDAAPSQPRRPAEGLPPSPPDRSRQPTAEDTGWTMVPEFSAPADFSPSPQPFAAAAQTQARSEIIIEHLDVLIHEPAQTSPRGAMQRDHSRALRARYLRRL